VHRLPGALYLYPRIHLSENARENAVDAGKEPDGFYTLALLDETGICVVPGSGFERHYRLTFLCPWVGVGVGKLERFHLKWVEVCGED
jgi:alanine transaminase